MFDQARFDALFGSQAFNLSDFYTLEVSPNLTPVVTPLPTTLPLFATGLGALSLLGWRRKRKAVAA